jgi:hypothetical protein
MLRPNSTEKYIIVITRENIRCGTYSSINRAVATSLTPATKPVISLPIIKIQMLGIHMENSVIKPIDAAKMTHLRLPYCISFPPKIQPSTEPPKEMNSRIKFTIFSRDVN